MPNQNKCTPPDAKNAFDRKFLAKFERPDEPPTAGEASSGGFWRVIELDGERYGLFRSWEDPKRGDEPLGVINERWLARLAAAFLPHVSRCPTVWSRPSEKGAGHTLYCGDRVIGQLRRSDPEIIAALNLAIAIAGSVESIAYFLEAVGAAALKLAGRIIRRRLDAEISDDQVPDEP